MEGQGSKDIEAEQDCTVVEEDKEGMGAAIMVNRRYVNEVYTKELWKDIGQWRGLVLTQTQKTTGT